MAPKLHTEKFKGKKRTFRLPDFFKKFGVVRSTGIVIALDTYVFRIRIRSKLRELHELKMSITQNYPVLPSFTQFVTQFF